MANSVSAPQNDSAHKKPYYRGTVLYYKADGAYGAIDPDEPLIDQGELYFHHGSLRDLQEVFEKGDRVIFYTTVMPNGLRADDVHSQESYLSASEEAEYLTGQIQDYDSAKKIGTIRSNLQDIPIIHFSFLSLQNPNYDLKQGDSFIFRIVVTLAGPEAYDISPQGPEVVAPLRNMSGEKPVSPPKASDFLAQALLAKEERRGNAVIQELYEKAMESDPNWQLVLNYASWLRQIRRAAEAMKVYKRGIKMFPKLPKLREDAGTLASSMRNSKEALELFHQALELARAQNKQGSIGTILRFLGREYYQIDTKDGLLNSIKSFNEAQSLKSLDKNEKLLLGLAKLRVQHHRGELAFRFFTVRNGFVPVYASLHQQQTIAGDMILRIQNDEFSQSYGLGNYILVRVMFKQDVSLSDLEQFGDALAKLSVQNYVDEQISFIVVASISRELEALLRNRLERQARENIPTVIPVSQDDIERDPNNALRNTLDNWIYKRDMFAGNQPVVGRRFFGRENPLKQVSDAIDAGQCIGIYGLRKIGKTSLLKQSMRNNESNDIVIYKELSGVPAETQHVRYLYWDISNQLRTKLTEKFSERDSTIAKLRWRLGGEFEDYFDISPDTPVHAYFDSDLRRVLRAIRELKISIRPRLIIMLDEIERLIPNPISGSLGFTDYYHFLGYVRAVNQEDNQFIVLVAGANPLISEIPQFERQDNPVFNFLGEVYLPFLEQYECSKMMETLGRGMGVRFESSAQDRIYALTGGHPFITRQLCSFIASHHQQRPVTISSKDVDNLVEPYLLDRGDKDFREIMDRLQRDFPSEYDVCIDIARKGGTTSLKELRAYANKSRDTDIVRHLTGYQIVTTDSERASITMRLLTMWLQSKESN